MKTKQTEFVDEDYKFMRQNRDIMSNQDFASYFKCSLVDINLVFTEMEYIVDWDASTGEYELIRMLNRFELANQWDSNEMMNDCLNFRNQYINNRKNRQLVRVIK